MHKMAVRVVRSLEEAKQTSDSEAGDTERVVSSIAHLPD